MALKRSSVRFRLAPPILQLLALIIPDRPPALVSGRLDRPREASHECAPLRTKQEQNVRNSNGNPAPMGLRRGAAVNTLAGGQASARGRCAVRGVRSIDTMAEATKKAVELPRRPDPGARPEAALTLSDYGRVSAAIAARSAMGQEPAIKWECPEQIEWIASNLARLDSMFPVSVSGA